MWLVYVALEPYVRRRWPVTLISWSRILAGSWRDPLVGRDVLFGILFGIFPVLISPLRQSVSLSLGAFPTSSDGLLRALSGGRLAISIFVFLVIGVAGEALVYLFMLFLLRLLTRRDWLAVMLFTCFFSMMSLFTGNWLPALWFGLTYGMYAVVLTRYGLVTMVSAISVTSLLLFFPVTLNFSVWYAGTAVLALFVILTLAALAFYTSLGGQQVFAENLLEE
jgi:serine/threonine-protein kinase